MTINTQKLPTFDNVKAGEEASTKLPRGATYKYLLLDFQIDGVDGDIINIDQITVVADNDTFIQISGTRLKAWNKEMGFPAGNGVFVVPFTDPRFQSPKNVGDLSLGTATMDSLTLEVKIKAGTANPTLKGWGVVYGGGRIQGAGSSLSYREKVENIGGSGDFPIDDLAVVGKGFLIHSIMFDNAPLIKEIEIALEGGGVISVRNRMPKDVNDAFRKMENRNEIVTGDDNYIVDFSGGELGEMLLADPDIFSGARIIVNTTGGIPQLRIMTVLARPVGQIGGNSTAGA